MSSDLREPEVREFLERMAQEMPTPLEVPPVALRRARGKLARTFIAGSLAAALAVVGVVSGTRAILRSEPQPGDDGQRVPIVPLTGVASSNFLVPISITVPESWTRVVDTEEIFVTFRPTPGFRNVPEVGIDVTLVENVYRDPCLGPGGGLMDPPLGPTPRDLVDYLVSIEALHASAPEPVTVGGYSGLAFEDNMRSGKRCLGGVAPWPLRGDKPYVIFESEKKRIMVLDVDGQRVVVVIVAQDLDWDNVLPEAEEVLSTLRFES